MAAELAELRKYVRSLEARMDSGSAPRSGPVSASASVAPSSTESDPLVAMEQSLGMRGGGQAATTTATPIPPPAVDPLSSLELEVSRIKSTQVPTGNPRTAFNPQVSVISDFVYRASSLDEDPATPDANGLPTGDRNRDRFSLRELEIAFQASIDPFSRADIFLELPGVLEEFDDDAAAANESKIAVEEAFITYWRLPYGLLLKGGKFRLEFGKSNREHNDNQHAIERPLVIQNFFGPEGIAEQGLSLQGFIPLRGPGTQLELTGQILNGEGGEETLFAGVGSDKTMALGRARLYHDISSSANVDVGTTRIAGRHDPAGTFAQQVTGYDLTFRYEPVDQNVYRNFIFRTEYLEGDRKVPVDTDGDGVNDFAVDQRPDGIYLMAQYQWDRFWNVGVRYDNTNPALRMAELAVDADPVVRDRALAGFDRVDARTVWLTHFTSEFNRWRLQYTVSDGNFPLAPNGKTGEDLLLLQWIFAMGPHGAHKY